MNILYIGEEVIQIKGGADQVNKRNINLLLDSVNLLKILSSSNKKGKIKKYLSQPFFVATNFTGYEGKYVPLKDTIRGFKEIVDGKMDDIPEAAFYMKGTIEEVYEAAKSI